MASDGVRGAPLTPCPPVFTWEEQSHWLKPLPDPEPAAQLQGVGREMGGVPVVPGGQAVAAAHAVGGPGPGLSYLVCMFRGNRIGTFRLLQKFGHESSKKR